MGDLCRRGHANVAPGARRALSKSYNENTNKLYLCPVPFSIGHKELLQNKRIMGVDSWICSPDYCVRFKVF